MKWSPTEEKLWVFVEPLDNSSDPLYVFMSESDIIKQYFPYWERRMREANKPDNLITHENCIQDWVVVNFAWQLTEDNLGPN